MSIFRRERIICESADKALLFIEKSLNLMRKESEEIIVVSFF